VSAYDERRRRAAEARVPLALPYREDPVTDPVVLAFFLIPGTLAVCLAWGAATSWRRAGAPASTANRIGILTLTGAAAWMAGTWIAAASGILADFWRTPPPFAFLVFAIILLAVALATSKFGARLSTYVPLWLLVGVQAFRFPLEIAMHAMYERGVMPVQMSYSGRNFDILTGISAIGVAILVRSGQGGRRLVVVWNIVGLALLINVVTVAILATPRFQYFGPDHVNTWVMQPPFVWLPAVMVLAALLGHLVIFRSLMRSSES
jgi:hypothetical protein